MRIKKKVFWNKPKKKKKRPSNRKLLIKELDSIVSLFVRARDKKCIVCGSDGTYKVDKKTGGKIYTKNNPLQNGHLFTRAAHSTRWCTLNCNGQCAGCNFRHEHDPYPYEKAFRNKFGTKAYDDLYKKHKTTVKFTDDDLLKMIFSFQDKYKLALEGFYESDT